MQPSSENVFGMLMVIVAVSLILLMAMVFLLRWGWRGRVVDDHPVCAKCGFDLTGGIGERCSECGAELSAKSGVRKGNRVRRGGVVGVAVAGMVVVLLVGSGLGWSVGKRVDWMPWKPLAWVEAEFMTGGVAGRTAGKAELVRRIRANGGAIAGFEKLADRLLAIQGDKTKPWFAAYGDVLEAMKLDEAREQQYLKQGVNFSLEVRPAVRQGRQLPYRLSHGSRLGSTRRLYVRYSTLRVKAGGEDDIETPKGSGVSGTTMLSASGGGSSSGEFWSRKNPLDKFAVGEEASLVFTLSCEVYESYEASSATRPSALAKVELEFPVKTKILPKDAADVTPVQAEGLAEAVRKSIKKLEFQKPSEGERESKYANLRVEWLPVPEDIAVKAFLVYGGKEVPISGMTVNKGKSTNYSTGGEVPTDLPAKVDVILRADPDRARGTVDLMTYADVEVVLKDVDTWRNGPATQAVSRPASRPAR